MQKILFPLAFGLLLPTAAIAQIDHDVAERCQDARDFYGCVRAFTTPPQSRSELAPFRVAAGLMSGLRVLDSPSNNPFGVNPVGLAEGIFRGVLR